ncbi:hypothetical protein MAR_013056 [Mya arenaria]|uniref:DUF4371 domain-containing protein n=1 Tax=Mya arenaria TaxID=6604 RepID=A0ABY7FYU9_MYAAR|nr:hypothetical protein MAR_013056 [Mya arenaria]
MNAFLMDGSTDISGDEQETLYTRTAKVGVIAERFLNIATTNTTRYRDLMDHVMDVFDKNKIGRKCRYGGDGASNMTGVRTRLDSVERKKSR